MGVYRKDTGDFVNGDAIDGRGPDDFQNIALTLRDYVRTDRVRPP